jgi:hypothetical protein
MAMEPDYLEPLNLVIKKDNSISKSEINEKNTIPVDNIEKGKMQLKIEDNMSVIQDAVKSTEVEVSDVDQKLLTALYMGSLMQMSNVSALRNLSPNPYNAQQNFLQLLAMVEARHRMWQHLSWPAASNFLRNPIGVPQIYYDSGLTNMNEQLSNTSILTCSLPSSKHEQTNHMTKQTVFKGYKRIVYYKLDQNDCY